MKDSYARTNNICLVFLTLCAGTVALVYLRPMLIPLIFSIFIYAVLAPVVQYLEKKWNAPKGLAVLAAMVLLIVSLGSIVVITTNSIETFLKDIDQFQNLYEQAAARIAPLKEKFDIQLDFEKILKTIAGPVVSNAQALAGQAAGIVGNLFLIFFFTIFMLTGESRSKKRSRLQLETMGKVSAYISMKSLLSFATGFLTWIILLSFNVQLASLVAILTVILNFIPTIGSIVAVLIPVPMLILQYYFGWEFFAVLILTGTLQFAIGNVIEPLVMGDSMDLHPIAVLLCLIFWGMVWGVPGMFLAVPVTAVLKIVFSRIEATKDLSEILAGRLP